MSVVPPPLVCGLPAGITIPLSAVSTPLMYLEPYDVLWINIATYLHVASTGILIWDFLNNLRNDLKLLTNHKLGIPTVLYFTIRLSLITYSLGRAVLLTIPVQDCSKLANAINVFLTICVASATTFFYLRMVAVYSQNRCVIGFFGVAWLGTIAMATLFTQTFGAEHIGPTLYCRETIHNNFLLAIIAFIWANDFLIYLAIAYRIYRIFADYDFEANLQRRLAILLFGASLPVGSKIVLLESQLSCLIIVVSKFFLVVGLSIEEEKWYMFIICHLVLMAILASRMYRDLRGVSPEGHQRPAATEFRTANLTSHEFRQATTQRSTRGQLETKSAALNLDETYSSETAGDDPVAGFDRHGQITSIDEKLDPGKEENDLQINRPRRQISYPLFKNHRESDIGSVQLESKWM